MMPFFSVIIPLYNKEAFIEYTIKSVLNQSFNDFEIILVDDGSTDNSYKIASKFDDIRINLIQQKNKGVSVARNVGIKNAKGKYIALLDADDIWHDNHLMELKKQILLFPEAGLYCNNYEILLQKGIFRKATFNFKFQNDCLIVDDYFKASIINPVAWTSAVGFSKEKFISIGQFDTTFKTAQDLDLWIRFALRYKVSFNPIITMSYKLYTENSLSKKEYNDIRYDFINNYTEQEQENSSLKLYLDINRYAVALRCKLNNEFVLYKKLKKQIDFKNLNLKQKLLINQPNFLLKLIKQIQNFLISKNIYLSAFK
ncbi:glycosyltransferase [Flavivirga abyssicola]|uniref:glycosyltransferase family 2 protein n=1 Tax=Flavivirga abyssicola TaxID=3063533 RepID=UPI0026E05E41|nr:glycosyltransferase [Flavivirga sp. MEBiC07777]WVK12045.1 glycosyltransferase [Flavivirga sp. MEBiC07777]